MSNNENKSIYLNACTIILDDNKSLMAAIKNEDIEKFADIWEESELEDISNFTTDIVT